MNHFRAPESPQTNLQPGCRQRWPFRRSTRLMRASASSTGKTAFLRNGSSTLLLAVIFNLGALQGHHGSSSAAEMPPVKIGLLLPPDEPQGTSVREGVLLARDHANATGTNHIEIIIRGRSGQWGADGVEAARMVTDDEVDGLIAPPDGAATHLTLQVSGRTAIPVVSLCADSSTGRTGVPWTLRVVPRTEDEARALFEGLKETVSEKTNRWTAIVPGGRAGREISKDLNRAAHASRVSLGKILELNPALTNSSGIRVKSMETSPDAILVLLPPVAAAQIARELRTGGYKGLLAGSSRLRSKEFIAAAGDAFEGFIIPAIDVDTNRARQAAFSFSFRESWHHEPDEIAAASYDAAMLLSYLLRQPEFQTPPHRLARNFSWPGVSGDVRFDEEGNRKARLVLLQGHNEKFIPAGGIRGD